MQAVATTDDLQVFIGYFEEPEPGVPDGHTGWYHSSGKFAVENANQVFTIGSSNRNLLADEVVGPFTCREEAVHNLLQVLDT